MPFPPRFRPLFDSMMGAIPCAGAWFLLLFATGFALGQPQALLRIVVVEGEGALNNIRLQTSADIVAEVRNAQQLPVTGATVTFVYPAQGPSGTFPDGSRTFTVDTDANGQARAIGVRPSGETGPLQIRIAASYQGQTATAVVNQTNVAVVVPEAPATTSGNARESAGTAVSSATTAPPARGMSKAAKVLLVIAIAAGAAAAGIVVANRDDDAGSGPPQGQPPVVITPGAPTVGGPQ